HTVVQTKALQRTEKCVLCTQRCSAAQLCWAHIAHSSERRRAFISDLRNQCFLMEMLHILGRGLSLGHVNISITGYFKLFFFSFLIYCSWSENPKEWKFQKTRQTWLLSHMYEKEKVPDEHFTILLDYLQGLKGSARDTTVQKAEALMQELDGSDAEDPTVMEKCERIRQVLQLLS
uniref:WKF domain-containing protein n=1 Tax=Meleagris gallopavo TaxID=9103 RepID=A0A803YE19_MELGA